MVREGCLPYPSFGEPFHYPTPMNPLCPGLAAGIHKNINLYCSHSIATLTLYLLTLVKVDSDCGMICIKNGPVYVGSYTWSQDPQLFADKNVLILLSLKDHCWYWYNLLKNLAFIDDKSILVCVMNNTDKYNSLTSFVFIEFFKIY